MFGALLTAFYMTRQVLLVFFGDYRRAMGRITKTEQHSLEHAGVPADEHPHQELTGPPHESPASMTGPLVILAVCAVLLGFVGTPAWPWFQSFLGEKLTGGVSALTKPDVLFTMGLSTAVVFAGIGLGYWLYGRKPITTAEEPDILEQAQPEVFTLLQRKYFVDEAYDWAFVGLNRWWARACDWLDSWVVNGLVLLCGYMVVGVSWVNRVIDEFVVNLGFDEICRRVAGSGGLMSRLQDGRVQRYLRIIGISLAALILALIWGCRAS